MQTRRRPLALPAQGAAVEHRSPITALYGPGHALYMPPAHLPTNRLLLLSSEPSMPSAIVSISALLLGAAMLLWGNGLQGILLPVRATIESFSTSTIGLIASGYSLGFVDELPLCAAHRPTGRPHPQLRRVGGDRRLRRAAVRAAGPPAGLDHAPHGERVLLRRPVHGDRELAQRERREHQSRPDLLDLHGHQPYRDHAGPAACCRWATPRASPCSRSPRSPWPLALVPIGLTTSTAPQPIRQVQLRLGRLYRMSPVGLAGCFFVGLSNGAFGGLGAVFAEAIGMSHDRHRAVHERRPDRRGAGPAAARQAVRPDRPPPGDRHGLRLSR